MKTFISFFFLLTSFAALAQLGESRVALVIGNGAYKTTPLKNPVNDSQDIAAKLKKLGFKVVERNNLQVKQIGSTLREFRSNLTPGGVALVFYAGHGVQIKGENFLPAVDAEIVGEEDVANQSLAIKQIMDVLSEAKTRLNIVFLDACRDNPYARSFRSNTKGLNKENAPSGTLISFATRPGSIASDGDGRNGLYTGALLKVMDRGDQPIEQLLKVVLAEVKSASKGQQEPWMEGSIEGDFCFGNCGTSAVTSVTPQSQSPVDNNQKKYFPADKYVTGIQTQNNKNIIVDLKKEGDSWFEIQDGNYQYSYNEISSSPDVLILHDKKRAIWAKIVIASDLDTIYWYWNYGKEGESPKQWYKLKDNYKLFSKNSEPQEGIIQIIGVNINDGSLGFSDVIKESNEWIEYHENNIFAIWKEMSRSINNITLFDKGRKLYSKFVFSNESTQVKWFLGYGEMNSLPTEWFTNSGAFSYVQRQEQNINNIKNIRDKLAWDLIDKSSTAGNLKAYLTKFPSGIYSSNAIERLKKLTSTSTSQIQGSQQPKPTTSSPALPKPTDISWAKMPGAAVDIAVGANGGLWAISEMQTIYRWVNRAWTLVAGSASHIAVDPQGSAWVVNKDGAIYAWSGEDWVPQPGALADIAIGANGTIWGVNLRQEIWRRGSIKWEKIDGAAVRVAVDPKGNAWHVNSQGLMWSWDGDGKWIQRPGVAIDIAICGNGDVYHVGSGRGLYKWNGEGWDMKSGSNLARIACDATGKLYAVNSAKEIWVGTPW